MNPDYGYHEANNKPCHSTDAFVTHSRSVLLGVVERYLDTHKYVNREELASLIGHELPAEVSAP